MMTVVAIEGRLEKSLDLQYTCEKCGESFVACNADRSIGTQSHHSYIIATVARHLIACFGAVPYHPDGKQGPAVKMCCCPEPARLVTLGGNVWVAQDHDPDCPIDGHGSPVCPYCSSICKPGPERDACRRRYPDSR